MNTVDIYLIHFEPAFKHAKHYLGVAKNGVERRFEEHQSGRGANLTKVAKNNGSKLILARVWYDLPRMSEKKWKRNGHSKRCPICCGRALIIGTHNDQMEQPKIR